MSRSDQVVDFQADETARLIEARGWTITDTYIDHGISGAKDTRPELGRMLSDGRRGRFDAVVVWRSDRLFRSLQHMVTTLEELGALGIAFISVTAPLDSSTPQGRLLTHLVAAFGEFERSTLIERTVAGMDAAKRRGMRIGRPRARVELTNAFHLRSQGMSMKEIARGQNIGLTTLRRSMKEAEQRGLHSAGPALRSLFEEKELAV